jgi:K+ transporter
MDFNNSCVAKIREGGWLPLTFGALVFIIMTTWHLGVEAFAPAEYGGITATVAIACDAKISATDFGT